MKYKIVYVISEKSYVYITTGENMAQALNRFERQLGYTVMSVTRYE